MIKEVVVIMMMVVINTKCLSSFTWMNLSNPQIRMDLTPIQIKDTIRELNITHRWVTAYRTDIRSVDPMGFPIWFLVRSAMLCLSHLEKSHIHAKINPPYLEL